MSSGEGRGGGQKGWGQGDVNDAKQMRSLTGGLGIEDNVDHLDARVVKGMGCALPRRLCECAPLFPPKRTSPAVPIERCQRNARANFVP